MKLDEAVAVVTSTNYTEPVGVEAAGELAEAYFSLLGAISGLAYDPEDPSLREDLVTISTLIPGSTTPPTILASSLIVAGEKLDEVSTDLGVSQHEREASRAAAARIFQFTSLLYVKITTGTKEQAAEFAEEVVRHVLLDSLAHDIRQGMDFESWEIGDLTAEDLEDETR